MLAIVLIAVSVICHFILSNIYRDSLSLASILGHVG